MDVKSTRLLRSGAKTPLIGLGTWLLDKDTAGTVEAALGLGYRLIDTSGDYGTQRGIGEGLKRAGLPRNEIFIVTKIEETDGAYEATRKNLDELGLDYADLMLIHRPPRTGAGEALWEGLMRARDDRLTRDIGVSNYSIDKIDRLTETSGEKPAVNQIEWSPFGYSARMLADSKARGVVIQAYSPLTRGKRLGDPALGAIAARKGRSPAQILLRWSLQMGTVPLPKANDRGHLKENIAVFDFELSEADMKALGDLNERYSSLGVLPYDGD